MKAGAWYGGGSIAGRPCLLKLLLLQFLSQGGGDALLRIPTEPHSTKILVAQICGERKEGAMMIMHYVYDVLADAV